VGPEQILAETDRCVKCGYCLPHCPTYGLSADEGESPRGRIALIQALIQDTVDSQRLHDHLDSCLACRACEAACPSQVHYGELITAVRAIQATSSKTSGQLQRPGLYLLSRAPYIQPLTDLVRIYQKLGVSKVTSRLGGKTLRRLNRLLPAQMDTTPWKELYPPIGKVEGRVGLFTGCIGRITDRPALDASIRVLNRLGFEVVVPPDQRCCGAMHLHSGDSVQAGTLARQNCDAFSRYELDAIVGVASGCSSHLVEYEKEGFPLSAPVLDISSFLCNQASIRDLKLRPLQKRVAVHTPCSMKNILKTGSDPHLLLEYIPDIDLFPLPENNLCCGAAGHYIITHPANADALREDKIIGLKSSQADILVTSNTGCSLHIAAGIREAGMEVEVLHPVELLGRQMAD
jgi:glycolate dehydrogenase iron-sulfur subunit